MLLFQVVLAQRNLTDSQFLSLWRGEYTSVVSQDCQTPAHQCIAKCLSQNTLIQSSVESGKYRIKLGKDCGCPTGLDFSFNTARDDYRGLGANMILSHGLDTLTFAPALQPELIEKRCLIKIIKNNNVPGPLVTPVINAGSKPILTQPVQNVLSVWTGEWKQSGFSGCQNSRVLQCWTVCMNASPLQMQYNYYPLQERRGKHELALTQPLPLPRMSAPRGLCDCRSYSLRFPRDFNEPKAVMTKFSGIFGADVFETLDQDTVAYWPGGYSRNCSIYLTRVNVLPTATVSLPVSTTGVATSVPATTSIVETTSAIATSSVVETTSAPATSSAVETTSAPATSSVVETTSAPATSSAVETTSAPATSSVVETTSAIATSSVVETTSAPATSSAVETTSAPATSSVVETTSAIATSSVVETTSAPATSSAVETTSAPATSSAVETTSAPATSSAVETTSAPATSSVVETTSAPATSSAVETTSAPATSSAVETTSAPATSSAVETTSAPATSSAVETTSAIATSSVETSAVAQTSTAQTSAAPTLVYTVPSETTSTETMVSTYTVLAGTPLPTTTDIAEPSSPKGYSIPVVLPISEPEKPILSSAKALVPYAFMLLLQI